MTTEHRQQFESALNTHYLKKGYIVKAMLKYDRAVSDGKIPRLYKTKFGNKHTNRVFVIEFCPVKEKFFSSDGWQGTSREKICGCGCAAYSHNPKNTVLI